MAFTKTNIPGLLIFDPKVFEDSRGYFFEAFNKNHFLEAGIDIDFIQDNQSSSQYGVIRGLHYQLNPKAQAKMIRVLSGRILDVVVDIRKGSPAYGKQFTLELSAENRKQLFIPKGFAHGFSVLSDKAEVFYKCDEYYDKSCEGGIAYNDAELNIDWQIPSGKEIISEKDLLLPSFSDHKNNFNF